MTKMVSLGKNQTIRTFQLLTAVKTGDPVHMLCLHMCQHMCQHMLCQAGFQIAALQPKYHQHHPPLTNSVCTIV